MIAVIFEVFPTKTLSGSGAIPKNTGQRNCKGAAAFLPITAYGLPQWCATMD